MNSLWAKFIIFLIFLKIGLVSFGGGYSVWSMIEQEFVQSPPEALQMLDKPLTEEKLFSFLEVGRITPGPVVNGTFLVAHHFGGLTGLFFSFIALLLPSAFAIVGLFHFNKRFHNGNAFAAFKKGALAAVVGVLIYFLYYLSKQAPSEGLVPALLFWVFAGFLFVLIHFKRANVVLVTVYSGLVMWAFSWFW
ncbi:MAG: chromate transporter [Deltaproteobacteria bacterium]|nr:chromate transporter [Deltaproteobacteria bacterium]